MSAAGTARPATFDAPLEGLRGLACLLVLAAHLFFERIDPRFAPANFWSTNLPIGREAVMLFFLISGYVIGLVSRTEHSPSEKGLFLWKRFLRLVPLYWLAIAASVAAFPIDTFHSIIAQIFFLQNTEPYFGMRLTVMKSNFNLWSLNYEVFYYLTFLITWRLRPSARALGRLIAILIAIGFIGWIFPHFPRIVTGYAVGGAFWYAGLWLVWYGRPVAAGTRNLRPWISMLLLLECTPHLAALQIFMTDLGFRWPSDPEFPFVSLRELQVLPIGFIILAAATRRQLPLPRLVWTLALLQPAGILLAHVVTGNFAALQAERLPATLFLIALLCAPWRMTESWLTWLCPTGLISYAVYIFARPVQYLIYRHFPDFSGTWWTYLTRIAVALALTLLVGYVMESIVQPRIRAWLRRTVEPRILGNHAHSKAVPASSPV